MHEKKKGWAFYRGLVRYVPWWALLSSGCAPVLLVGGWTVAELLHGPGYDPATETISVLGADGTSGQWVMAGMLIALGICHLVTAWGLRVAAPAGRMALACGGVAAIVLAMSPPPSSGGSFRHGSVVAVGFTLLALWPVLAVDRRGAAPWALRPTQAIVASALMVIGAAWFLVELQIHGAAGVAERVLTFAQALWPFVVAASCLRHRRNEEHPAWESSSRADP